MTSHPRTNKAPIYGFDSHDVYARTIGEKKMETTYDLEQELAKYGHCLEDLTFRVAWSEASNEPVFLFDQIDQYYTERGFSWGARYAEQHLRVGCIPAGRQLLFSNLMNRFNNHLNLELSYT
jgi:hypothetical protein